MRFDCFQKWAAEPNIVGSNSYYLCQQPKFGCPFLYGSHRKGTYEAVRNRHLRAHYAISTWLRG